MKILMVIDGFGSGGAQRQMVNLAIGLTRRGHRVEFAIYHPEMRHLAPIVEAQNIPIHTIPRHPRRPLSIVSGLRDRIKANRYETVLAFMEAPSLYSELALIGNRTTRLVISERTAFPPSGQTITHRVLHECHRLADWITVNSHHQRNRMIQSYPWIRMKSTTIYNGVDPSVFAPGAHPYPRENTRLHLLSIGTVIPRKNASGLVRALAVYRELHGEPPAVTWVGRVENSERGRTAFAEACGLLKELQLEESWTWLGERTDVPALLNGHDALMHPSFLEGLPNAVGEAMACARPVLASNVCDHAILVEDGRRGLLFDPHAPAEIAAVMYRFAKMDQGERQLMGKRALEYARQELSLDAYVDAYAKLFEQLQA